MWVDMGKNYSKALQGWYVLLSHLSRKGSGEGGAPGFGTWALPPPALPVPPTPRKIAAPGPHLRWSDFPSALPPSDVSGNP